MWSTCWTPAFCNFNQPVDWREPQPACQTAIRESAHCISPKRFSYTACAQTVRHTASLQNLSELHCLRTDSETHCISPKRFSYTACAQTVRHTASLQNVSELHCSDTLHSYSETHCISPKRFQSYTACAQRVRHTASLQNADYSVSLCHHPGETTPQITGEYPIKHNHVYMCRLLCVSLSAAGA